MGEINAGLNLVLLGKTGAGKSAAGNTILGKQAFKSRKSPKSITQDVSMESNTVCGYPVTVYDTPGYFDTGLTEDEIQLKYKGLFQKCESGPCVFLLVIKTDRFTEEERKTVEKIEKLLGQNRLNKTWILFTGGDQLEEENMTIKEFINETEPLKRLVQKYEQRYHVFNNKKKGHIGQVQRLILKFLACFKTMGARLNHLTRKLPNKAEQATSVSSLQLRRIVLLGKTGVGKSAAGNTILGQKKFRSEMSSSSVTCKCSLKQATVSGRSVSVVDTPGFFDTKMDPEELAMEIARSVYISSPGPHAFLIVFPLGRFTEHEQQIPQIIEMMFGQEVLKYSIILFTHGDQLRRESVEEIIERNQSLRNLVQECGGRFHVFNNKKRNKRKQVDDLLQKIDSMIEQNGGGHYSNQMFEDAQRFRREEEEQRLREEEERKQKDEEERKQREEEERKQQEEEKRQEIERVKKETEERLTAEFETQLKLERERFQAPIKSENNETKKQEEQQQQDNTDGAKTDEKPSENDKPQPKPEPETSSWFKQFWHKYHKHFLVAAGFVIGAAIGGAVIGGVVLGGAVLGAAVIGGTVIGGAVAGGVIGAFLGTFAGRAGNDGVNADAFADDAVNDAVAGGGVC
ncbi:GTPase IMAP family member 8-like [Pseudorasbora parva]|uniref:GTPase IMAP family member 8-like n=1 Tax=Pseudorasbora parva TaxID=51549 RepID=UPI00351F2D37